MSAPEQPGPQQLPKQPPRTDWPSRVDRWAGWVRDAALGWGFPLMYGVFVGSSAWWWAHADAQSALGDNRMSSELRSSAVVWAITGAAAMLALYAAAHGVVRRVAGAWPGPALTRSLNVWLVPCLGLPFWMALSLPLFERRHPQLAVLFPLLIAATCVVPIFRAELPRWLASWARFGGVAAGAALVASWILYSWFFSSLAITNHHGLHTATFDLGLYDNIFYQTLHGRLLGCSFLAGNYHGSAHFDPILILLSPFYLLYPRAESLLVLQSAWLGAGVFPLYLLARHHQFGRTLSVVFASVWLLYPALHGSTMYEFHSLSLVAPLIVSLLYCLEIESRFGYWLSVTLALLVREDIPLLLCFIGVASMLTSRRFAVRQGWLTIAVSLLYFVLVKAFFMSAPEQILKGTTTYSFAFYYRELIPNGTGIGELLSSLLTNPGYVLQLILLEEKVQFLLLLFAPLGFLPFLARGWRFALIYGLVFCLLATREPVYSIYFQYACIIFAVAFPLTLPGVHYAAACLRRTVALDISKTKRALIAGMWITTALVCFKFGGFVENAEFKAGFSPPNRHLDERELRRYAWVEQAAASIPKEASVGTTRRLGPHVSNRPRAYEYPSQGHFDYLFLDEGQLKPEHKKHHDAFIGRGQYEVLTRFEKLVLLRRSKP